MGTAKKRTGTKRGSTTKPGNQQKKKKKQPKGKKAASLAVKNKKNSTKKAKKQPPEKPKRKKITKTPSTNDHMAPEQNDGRNLPKQEIGPNTELDQNRDIHAGAPNSAVVIEVPQTIENNTPVNQPSKNIKPYEEQLADIIKQFDLPYYDGMALEEVEEMIDAARKQNPSIPVPVKNITSTEPDVIKSEKPYLQRLKDTVIQYNIPYSDKWGEKELETVIHAARNQNPSIPLPLPDGGIDGGPVNDPLNKNNGSIVVNANNIDQMIKTGTGGGAGTVSRVSNRQRPKNARNVSSSAGSSKPLPPGFQQPVQPGSGSKQRIDMGTKEGQLENIGIIGKCFVHNARGHFRPMTMRELEDMSVNNKNYKSKFDISIKTNPLDKAGAKICIKFDNVEYDFPESPNDWIKIDPNW